MSARTLRFLMITLATLALELPALAANSGITYQGRILKPDGAPLSGSNTQFKLQIRTPDANNCLMYEEVQALNLSQTSGQFSLTINDGSGARTDSTGLGLDRIFANRGSFTFDPTTCSTGNAYTPNQSDGRNLVVLFKDETMASWEPIPAQKINFVPFAFEAKQVAGFTADSLLRVVNGSGDPLTGLAPLSNAQYNALLDLLNGTSAQYTKAGQLNGVALPTMNSGEVLGWNGSAWVSQTAVGGANSVTTTMIQNGAVDGTKLDPAISISTSGTIASAITTTRDFKIYAPSPSTYYVGMLADPTLAASYTLTWPLTKGTNGQVLTSDGSGKLTWTTMTGAPTGSAGGDLTGSYPNPGVATVGTSTAANIHSAELLANAATAANTPNTIVKRDASGNFSAGAISAESLSSSSTITATGAISGASVTSTGAVTAGSVSSSGPVTGTNITASGTLTAATVKTDTLQLNNAGSVVNVVNPMGAAYTLTLPANTGTTGQVLTTNGSGVTSWTSPLTSSTAFVQGGNTFGVNADLGTNDAYDLNLRTGGTTKVTVTAGGKVGIGTTSPLNELNVIGSGSFTGTLYAGYMFANNIPIFHLLSSPGGTAGYWARIANVQMSQQYMNWYGVFDFASGNISTRGINARVYFRAKQNNPMGGVPHVNVEVDSSNTVLKTSDVVAVTTVNSGALTEVGLYVRLNSNFDALAYTATTSSTWSDLVDLNPSTLAAALPGGTQTAAVIGMTKWDFGAPTNSITYTAGSVGIGTTSPVTKLEVAGSLRVGDGGETCDSTRAGAIRYNGGNLQFCAGSMPWTTLGTAGSGLTALTGDVTATGPGSATATVASVGGSTAANVHSAELLANAATNANTASTIVKRDGSGNFSAGAISATSLTATGAVTQGSAVFKDSGSNTVTVQAPTTVSSSYVLKWPTAAGGSGDVLTTDASGNLSWTTPSGAPTGSAGGDLSGSYPNPAVATVGTSSAANVHSAELLANAATAANTSNAIVKRDGTGNFTANVGTFNGVALNNAGSIVNLVNPIGAAYTLTLPTGTGSNGQVLTTNGSGVTSWSTALTDTTGFVQGGNTFGANANLGTNDGFDLNFRTGGTTKMTVTSAGNVGIGTTSPSNKLHVYDTSHAYLKVESGASAKQANIIMKNADQQWSLGVGTGNHFSIFDNTAASDRLHIDTSGNVGIGTTNPGYPLHVVKNDGVSATYHDQVNFEGPTTFMIFGYEGNGSAMSSSYIRTGTSLPLKLGTQSTPSAITVLNSGNVGIGTTSPRALLDLDKSSPAAANWAVFTNNVGGSNPPSFFRGLAFGFNKSNASAEANVIYGTGGGSTGLAIGSYDGTTYNERMRFNTAGDVGIGTTSPGYKLDVNGAINATAVKINGVDLTTGGGDFMKDGSVAMTGAFLAANGSVTAPSISFANDTNTGFWSAANDRIQVSTGGVNRMQIYSNLDSYIPIQIIDGTAASPTLRFLNSATSGLFSPGANAVGISTAGSERIRIDASGNVGIGTTAPTAALEVATTAKFGGDVNITSTTAASNPYTGALLVAGGIGVTGTVHSGGNFINQPSVSTVYASSSGSATNPTGAQVLTQNNSGTDGSMVTHILRPRNTAGNYQNAYISSVSTTGAGSYTPFIAFGQQTGANTYSERMRIDTNGNLGIGTTNPYFKLDVQQSDADTHLNIQNNSSSSAHFPGVLVQNYGGTSGGSPSFTGIQFRGNSGAPQPVQSGDSLFMLSGLGASDTSYGSKTGGLIQMQAAETFSSTAAGTNISISTAPVGSTTLQTRLMILNDGKVGIGTTNPSTQLEVSGVISSTSGGVRYPDGTTQTTGAVTILHGSATSSFAAGLTRYIGFGFADLGTAESGRQIPLPMSGTLSKFYLNTNSAQGTGGDLVCTIRKNASDTSLSITIPANAAGGVFSDTSHSVAVSEGDLIAIRCVNSSSGSSATLTAFSAIYRY